MISEAGIARLKRHEGFRKDIYKDSVGIDTWGYGWNLSTGITEPVAAFALAAKVEAIEQELLSTFDWYPNLTQVRKDVILNMCYNMGIAKFKTFINTINLIAASKHEEASVQMLKSRWAEQVGNRAKELSELYRRG
jgi:Phage-related lysozyme (muraminidase)